MSPVVQKVTFTNATNFTKMNLLSYVSKLVPSRHSSNTNRNAEHTPFQNKIYFLQKFVFSLSCYRVEHS